MRTFVLRFALVALPAALFAADAPTAAEKRAAEQMQLFKAEAAQRALADLKKTPGYDYAKWAPAVEKLIAEEASVRAALAGGDAKARAVAAETVDAYRRAMLANPVLNFGKILCIHRDLTTRAGARGPLGGRGCGLLGLNAHNHWDSDRTGWKNEIGYLDGIASGEPAFKKLYAPADGTSLVRDLDLDFDASRILFTTYRGTNNLFGVYEIPASGAVKATEVSPAEHGDIQWWDGCYLPHSDQVVFLGTAAYQFLPCEDGNLPMCVMYRLDRKTGEIRQLTYEQDSDYTPSITHDGRILFTRWEYSDLPHYFSRVLMTMNPDGVGQLALWGSGSYVPTFFYCARTVPGDAHKITMFGGGHHDDAEVGRMFMIDPTLARAYPFKYDPPDRSWGPIGHILRIPAKNYPAEKTGMVHEFPGWGKDVEGDVSDPYTQNQFARGKPYFSFPYPLSEKYHLANVKGSRDALFSVALVDVFDNITIIAQTEDGAYFEPTPFAPRTRPPVIPDRSKPGEKNCSVHIADIYNGPGLAGIPRGTVKKLRLFSYHYNYHNTGGHSRTGLDRVESAWDVKRPLGTVDVEEDGSACFEMPANTPISLQPIDAEGRAVQLMRSWVVGMPGERVSCTGCHEDNRTSVKTSLTIADKKYHKGEIQKIKPLDADGVRPWGFANEVWPVVARRCAACHGDVAKAPKRGADQGGLHDEKDPLRHVLAMPNAEEAYRMLHPYIRRPGPESDATVLTPMDYHASTSPLVRMLKRGHHGVELAQAEYLKFYEWIDLNAPWLGKWTPQGFQTDAFVVGCNDQIKRRKDLLKMYAATEDDPEGEYDAYAEKVASRPVKAEAPTGKPAPQYAPVNVPGWPMDLNAAYNAQVGGIRDLAPVTTKSIDIGNGQSIVFRRIPAGTFVMGSDTGAPDERPACAVKIEKPFWISETEIRNEQYNVFDAEHDSGYQDQFGKDHVVPGYIGNHRRMPVVRVSWKEADAFCKWLSAKAGVKADLPTEAQWEWAARAGTATPFPWGGLDDDYSKYANFADKDVRNMNVFWDGGGAVRRRHPFAVWQNFPLHDERWQDDWFTINFVARANANPWGLYDMHGNAAEWTKSEYRPYPYKSDDGRESSKSDAKRVARGGSFASRPRDATSSSRLAYEPWQKVFDVGFRVILADD